MVPQTYVSSQKDHSPAHTPLGTKSMLTIQRMSLTCFVVRKCNKNKVVNRPQWFVQLHSVMYFWLLLRNQWSIGSQSILHHLTTWWTVFKIRKMKQQYYLYCICLLQTGIIHFDFIYSFYINSLFLTFPFCSKSACIEIQLFFCLVKPFYF